MNKFIYAFVFVALTAVSMVTQANVSVPIQPRIVGGQQATPNSYPFMGSLQSLGQHFCAATYIGGNRVLTAAHCVDDKHPTSFYVKFGGHDINKNSEWDTYQVTKIIAHEDYNSYLDVNDIALLELDRRVTNVTPVTLADDTIADGDIRNSFSQDLLYPNLRVIGWGHTEERGNLANKLREVDVPYVHQGSCEILLGVKGMYIADSMFCAGHLLAGGEDACQGDSGGPVIVKFNNEWVQVGIVSKGVGCGRQWTPGVYTDVAYYENWLADYENWLAENDNVIALNGRGKKFKYLDDNPEGIAVLFKWHKKVTIELADGEWFKSSVLPTDSSVLHGSTYTIRSSAMWDHYVKYNIGEQDKQMVQTVSNGDSFTLTFNAVTQRWSASSNFPAKITTNKEIRCLNPDDTWYTPEVCRNESIPNLQDLLTEFDNVYVVMTDGNWTKRIRTPEYYYGKAVGEGVDEKRVYLQVKSSWSAWLDSTEIGPSVGDTRRLFSRVTVID